MYFMEWEGKGLREWGRIIVAGLGAVQPKGVQQRRVVPARARMRAAEGATQASRRPDEQDQGGERGGWPLRVSTGTKWMIAPQTAQTGSKLLT
jgi:hypothetical protein